MREQRYFVADLKETLGNSVVWVGAGSVPTVTDVRRARIFTKGEIESGIDGHRRFCVAEIGRVLPLAQHHVLRRSLVKMKLYPQSDRFVLQDIRQYCGNSAMWWCWDGGGYTVDIRCAGVFTRAQAERQCRSRPSDRMWPLDQVIEFVEHHIDIQDLRRIGDPQRQISHVFSHLKPDAAPRDPVAPAGVALFNGA